MSSIRKNIVKILLCSFAMVILISVQTSKVNATDVDTSLCSDDVNCDYGDAPESYGPGGIISDSRYNLTNMFDDTNFVDSENVPNYSDDATGDDLLDNKGEPEETGWVGSDVSNMYYDSSDDTFKVSFYTYKSTFSSLYADGSLGMWFDIDQSGTYDEDEAFIFQHDDLEFNKFYSASGIKPYLADEVYQVTLSIDMSLLNDEIKANFDSSYFTFMRLRTFSEDYQIDPTDASKSFSDISGVTQDYRVKVLVDNKSQVCTTILKPNEPINFTSKEVSKDKKTFTFKDVVLNNGDVVDVVVSASDGQDLMVDGYSSNYNTGSTLAIRLTDSAYIYSQGSENNLTVNTYVAGTTTDYPLALSFQFSGFPDGQNIGIPVGENDNILTGRQIVSSENNGFTYFKLMDNPEWITGASTYLNALTYTSNEEKSEYYFDTKFDDTSLSLGEMRTYSMTISTTAYQSSINLDDCSDELNYFGTTNGFTDEDETRTTDVVDFEYNQDLSIESNNVSYFNYPDDDFLGYQITVPSKYNWENLASNITVYSADKSSEYANDSSAWTEVDPSHISFTYNDGLLDIHVNDTYPGFDDLINNNNQFKFVVGGFALKDRPTDSTVSTEEFTTRAYVQSTTEGEVIEYDKDLDTVNVTDIVTDFSAELSTENNFVYLDNAPKTTDDILLTLNTEVSDLLGNTYAGEDILTLDNLEIIDLDGYDITNPDTKMYDIKVQYTDMEGNKITSTSTLTVLMLPSIFSINAEVMIEDAPTSTDDLFMMLQTEVMNEMGDMYTGEDVMNLSDCVVADLDGYDITKPEVGTYDIEFMYTDRNDNEVTSTSELIVMDEETATPDVTDTGDASQISETGISYNIAMIVLLMVVVVVLIKKNYKF